jgi:hypothetical protein
VSKKLVEEEMFAGYPLATRAFYGKIIYMMLLNDLAYRRGYFDVRLCDTNDPFTWFRFVEQIPDIKLWLDIDDDIEGVTR